MRKVFLASYLFPSSATASVSRVFQRHSRHMQTGRISVYVCSLPLFGNYKWHPSTQMALQFAFFTSHAIAEMRRRMGSAAFRQRLGAVCVDVP